MAARPSCHNCVYACWDLCQAMQSFSSGFPHRPRCANQPAAPAIMRPTPIGSVCVNYRAKPKKPEGDNVKAIPLADGFYAYVDAADYEWLNQYGWRLYGGYAGRYAGGRTIFMHREIMKPPKGMVVDHIDGNKANNCRFNLRNCTRQENQQNRAKCKGTCSRFKGIWFNKKTQKWCAALVVGGKRIYLGYFTDEREAARAYDRAAVQYFGAFARLNFPEEWPPQRRVDVAKEHEKAEGKRQETTRRGDACVAPTRKEQKRGARKRATEDRGRRTSERTRRRAPAAKRSKRTTQNAQRKTSKRTARRVTGHKSRATPAKPRAKNQRVTRRRSA